MNVSMSWKFAGLVAGALMLLMSTSGCAARAGHSPATIGKAEQAVMCDGCETVWVQVPDLDSVYMRTYTAEPMIECPDCRSAVATFFSIGAWEHTCAKCGGTLKHCTVHKP
ncbi:MAG TPA: hypothetical protein VFD43_10935 [Planctomycetota bacterium]|nr:hypothetical protein [Planctomycetota bacterium]